MRAAIMLVLRCGLAVTVTTAAVQLWSMALQDDVPLPAPILALPVTDNAAAARSKRVPTPTQPAVVVSVQLVARAVRPPRPAASPRRSEPPRKPSPSVVVRPPPAARPPPPAPEPEPVPAQGDPPPNHNAHVLPHPLHLSLTTLIDPHPDGATDEANSGGHDPHYGHSGHGPHGCVLARNRHTCATPSRLP
jgi:hypothetical protein